MLATVCFAFQIYCDFSAYSDIVTGVARLLGIRLMRNFAYPYFSQSVGEFWRRWHISLSTWFCDYVYIPLGSRPANNETPGGLVRLVGMVQSTSRMSFDSSKFATPLSLVDLHDRHLVDTFLDATVWKSGVHLF